MAALTWRNVESPDFRASMQGFQTANQLMNDAFGNVRSLLAGVDQQQTDKANNAFQLELLRYNDPAKLEAALAADPTLGFDPRRINSESLSAARQLPGQLIRRATDQQALDENTFDFGEKKASIERMTKAAPLIRQAQLLAANGQETESNALLEGVDLRPDEFANILKGNFEFASSNQTLKGSRQSYGQSAGRYAREVKAWDVSDKADEVFSTILNNSQDQTDALGYLNGLKNSGKITAPVYNEVYKRFGLPGLDAGASIGSGAAGGAAGGSFKGDPYNVVFGFGQYGSPSKNLTDMTMGEAFSFGRNVLQPSTAQAGFGRTKDGRVVGTSAMGAYQFTATTLEEYGKKLYGDNWKNTQLTPDVQDKLAEALFNDRKAGNLKDTWEGLPDARPGAYKDISWNQMRGLIMQHEIGVSPSELRGNQAVSLIGGINANNDASANPITRDYYANAGRTGNVQDAYAEAKEKYPALAQMTPSRFTGAIADVQKKARAQGVTLNAFQAASLLSSSLEEQGLGSKVLDYIKRDSLGGLGAEIFGQDNIGGNFIISDDLIDEGIKFIKKGGAQGQKLTQDNIAFGQEIADKARNDVTSAQARLNAAINKGLSKEIIAKRTAELELATSAYRTATQAVSSSAQTTFFTEQTPKPAGRQGWLGTEGQVKPVAGAKPKSKTSALPSSNNYLELLSNAARGR